MAQTIFIAIIGGILPSLIWLAFWLFEDRCEPEPKFRLILTFLAGMAAVGFVLPLELKAAAIFSGAALLILWAVAEELFKFGAAIPFGLGSRDYDEPIDAVIYLITAALGFSAAENALYLFASLGTVAGTAGLLTGDLRFIGATLLHTLASATIGLAIAFAYNHGRAARLLAALGGLILAIVLHTLFNFFILLEGGARALYVFLPIWLCLVALLALLERVKNPARDYC